MKKYTPVISHCGGCCDELMVTMVESAGGEYISLAEHDDVAKRESAYWVDVVKSREAYWVSLANDLVDVQRRGKCAAFVIAVALFFILTVITLLLIFQ